MKKLLTCLLAVTMLLSCITIASAESEEQIELRFAWWGDTNRHEVYNAICDEFEAIYPNVTIIREPGTFNDFFDKLATQLAGNAAPDIFGMHPRFAVEFASRGAMTDLTPYVESGILNLDKLSDAVINDGKIDGKLYMISQGITLNELLANQTMLDRIGVEVPDITEDWTWDDLVAKAYEFREKALAAGEDVYFCDMFYEYNFFRIYLRSYGYELFNEDFSLGHDEAIVEKWFAMWQQMMQDDVIPDAATTTENVSAALEMKSFAQGLTAVTQIPVNRLDQYQLVMDDKVVAVRSPLGAENTRGVYIEGAHNAIYSGASEENKEWAARFLDFFTNDERCLKHLLIQQGTPVNSDMNEYIKQFMTEPQKYALDYVALVQPLAGTGAQLPAGYSEMNNTYAEIRDKVLWGEITPAEAAEEYCTRIMQIVEENQK